MKKTIIILIIVSFFVSWAGPLSPALAASGDGHGKNHASGDGGPHYCEISKGPCKHKDACPLKNRHAKKAHDSGSAYHHGEDGSDNDGPYLIASKCHLSSEAHQGSFYTIEHLFITTLLSAPLRWDAEAGFFSREEPKYIDNISPPFLRPPQSS